MDIHTPEEYFNQRGDHLPFNLQADQHNPSRSAAPEKLTTRPKQPEARRLLNQ